MVAKGSFLQHVLIISRLPPYLFLRHTSCGHSRVFFNSVKSNVCVIKINQDGALATRAAILSGAISIPVASAAAAQAVVVVVLHPAVAHPVVAVHHPPLHLREVLRRGFHLHVVDPLPAMAVIHIGPTNLAREL